jgi:uncharacterized protein (DUF1778 family)
MPTLKPRIALTLTTSQADLFRRMAELQQTSMAKVVLQLVEQVEPAMREVVVALEAAQAAKGRPAAQVLAAMARLQTVVQESTNKAVDQVDMFSGQIERAKKRLNRGPVKRGRARKRAGR